MKKVLLIFGILIVPVMLVLAALGFLILSSESVPVTDSDRELLVTIEDIAPYFEDFEPDKKLGKYEKLRYLDGVEELTYEFDSASDSDPYLSVTVDSDNSVADAKTTYAIAWSMSTVTLRAMSVSVVEDNEVYKSGDESRFGNLTNENGIVGHIFVARKGNRVYSFMISGFTIGEKEIWNELLDERMSGL